MDFRKIQENYTESIRDLESLLQKIDEPLQNQLREAIKRWKSAELNLNENIAG